MITDKTFTKEEFDANFNKFGQTLADKCNERVPGTSIQGVQTPDGVKLSIIQPNGNLHTYRISHLKSGHVQTLREY